MDNNISENECLKCKHICYRKAHENLDNELIKLKKNIKEDNSIQGIIRKCSCAFLSIILFKIWVTPFKRFYLWIKK